MEKEKFKKYLYSISELAGKCCKKSAGLTLILFFVGMIGFLWLDLIERSELKTKLKNKNIKR